MKSVTTDSSYSLWADTNVLADGHRFSWWAAECRREPADRTRAISFVQLERLWRRDDVAVREKALWRLLYETAARAGDVLPLNVEDLELENNRARVRFKAATSSGWTPGQGDTGSFRV